MTRKINPTSLRLGLTQVWDFTIPNYNSFNSYILLIFKWLQVNSIIIKILRSNKFLISDKELLYINNKLFLNIYITDLILPSHDKYFLITHKLSKILLEWFSLKICLRIYRKMNYTIMPNLILNYAAYLLEYNRNPNKIIWQVYQLLKGHINSSKIIYCTKGIRLVYLKGFKIQLVGRFDNTKSQMAKSIQQNLGSLSLVSLKSYVEFSHKNLHTKLGSCGLKVWLFYEIN
uniref:ribosomal protein S3 n=1 Tax=Hydropuntia eucheumatoides TaxID=172970 RepID=UPI002E76EB6E|nr:ribosomal protein S3 [Gracilaria eucheumatoides]WPS66060.1 ribosomal protein S3 [Gracilaria eucheumatoides]